MASALFRSRLRLALAIALALTTGGADAATITVTAGGDSGTAATCTLRQAISTIMPKATTGTGCVNSADAFGTNDTIVFDGTLTAATITLSLGQLSVSGLTAPLTIQGSGQTIDAGDLSRVLYVQSTTLTVSGLTLTGGRAANYGGGVNVTSSYGGGVYATSSTVTLTNSTVSGNYAVNEGGGVWANDSTVTLTNSSVSGNFANNPSGFSKGGGVYASGSALTLTSSSVSGNSAFAGGGAYAGGGTLTLNSSTVSGNSAFYSGAVRADTVTLTNSTVSGNYAVLHGGGVWGSTVTLTNSTVSGNRAEYDGGVVAGTDTLTNTILCGNTSAKSYPDLVIYGAIPASAAYSLLGTALDTSSYNASGNHNIFSDSPGLGAFAGNGGLTQTMALLSGSPAINAGSNALIPVGTQYDQRGAGYPRIVDGTVDIGAFEFHDLIFVNGFESGP